MAAKRVSPATQHALCAVAYLYREGIWSDPVLRLKTKSGIKNYEFLDREAEAFWFLAELGKPVFRTFDDSF